MSHKLTDAPDPQQNSQTLCLKALSEETVEKKESPRMGRFFLCLHYIFVETRSSHLVFSSLLI